MKNFIKNFSQFQRVNEQEESIDINYDEEKLDTGSFKMKRKIANFNSFMKTRGLLIERANRRLLGESISAGAFDPKNLKKIDGLSYGKYLKNIKAIVTSMIELGQQMLDKNVNREDKVYNEKTKKYEKPNDVKVRQDFCAFVKTEMKGLTPLVIDLLERMKSDAELDLKQLKLLPMDEKLSWEDFSKLMSENYNSNKSIIMAPITAALKVAIAPLKAAMKSSIYVDSTIVKLVGDAIKQHCGSSPGSLISSLMMDSIGSVVSVQNTGTSC